MAIASLTVSCPLFAADALLTAAQGAPSGSTIEAILTSASTGRGAPASADLVVRS